MVGVRAAQARVCERNVGTLRAIYPVGAIYISTTDNNPANLFGFGTWQRFGNGRALVGVDEENSNFNTAQQVGGAETHTLTVDEMPSHTHSFAHAHNWANSNQGSHARMNGNTWESTSATGGNQPHNNLPPYITVYIWRRTA